MSGENPRLTGPYRSPDRDRPWVIATRGRVAQSVLVVSYETFAMFAVVSMLTSPVPPAHGERLTLWLYGASAVTGVALAVLAVATRRAIRRAADS